jgi:predicted nucleic acid-binding Zn ribbon protein
MAQLKCPQCNREFVRRVARVGFTERLLGLFCIYPFKCQLCGFRFRILQRGVRYIRIEEDQREYDRIQMSFPLTFSSDADTGEGLALNISMGGCNFNATSQIRDGTIVKLALKISSDAAPVIVDAAVVRYVRNQLVGVEFLQWQPSERERLQLFVRGLLIGR